MAKTKRDDGDLRRRAEERLGHARPRPPRVPEADARRLVHELQVHQIELELQNEELRSSRAEVEAALERYTQLFDFAPVGYLVVGPDGAIGKANFAAARLLGRERGRLAGAHLAGFIAAEDTVRLRRFLAAATMKGAGFDPPPEPCDLRLAVAGSAEDGERVVRLSASDLVGAAPASVLLALEDVTERWRAAQALRDESRHKDEFLATLSHELRNPLGPIRNGLFLLERLPPGCEQSHGAMAVIERQLGHLTRIVEDLLDVTRIARGKVQLARQPLDLGELVRRTLEDHRPGFENRGIALESRIDGECWVDGDPTRLVQVIGNLLGNSQKFTERGGRVEVSLRREGRSTALAVKDTGMGIDPEVRDRVFEPFSQGRQPLDRTRGGLGLGLSTVKGLVELHGGTVALASEGTGKGTELTVRLPLIAAPASPRATIGPPAVAHRRVLVIEDNQDAAVSLKQVLELCGHEVQLAPDGPTGLALAHAQHPEIIICDIGLPGMDGYEVARALRADAVVKDTYLIALTGYARPDDERRATEAGFDRHMGKPPPLGRLEALLADVPERVRPAQGS